MEKKELYERVLEKALSRGGDFAELYLNHSRYNSLHLVDGGIDAVGDNLVSGAGIRV